MTQESQDIFGVYALKNKRKVLNEVVNLDDANNVKFENLIDALSKEWASFPIRAASNGDMQNNATSNYEYTSGPRKGQKQPALKINDLWQIYYNGLVKLKGLK